ncbi:MAG TPA: ATP-binding protein [Bacteroidia bacterium]|jgi:NadR type nicotinamide-nucleotide adenylyltransferase|nr:ATP-binding protein [Bacteroidia bacterium]
MEQAIKKIIRIAIVGPESTGKSTLAEQLAKYYSTCFVPEYAREYINNLQSPYTIDDIIAISKRQMQLEDDFAQKANKLLICDTNLVVTKIWAEFKYHQCPEWIKENIAKRKYALHLLTSIDLPWEADPQREHPHLREELFEIYKNELAALKINYSIISGEPARRLQQAIKAIDEVLKS